jgi:hypothetical protein
MKREGSAPDLVRAAAQGERPRAGDRPRTEEFDAADDDDQDVDDARPRPIVLELQTAEVDVVRDRRVTLMSPIPAEMAESMARGPVPASRRDPAAPQPEPVERTRRVGDSDSIRARSRPTSQSEIGVASCRHRAALYIDEARAAFDVGDITAAVTAAEAAMSEADEAPPPGIIEVIEPARPLLTRVFATYVGPSSSMPVLAPRADDIARQRLGERERAVLLRVDGTRTLQELFDGSGLGSTDALRVVARLIRSGAIRIV